MCLITNRGNSCAEYGPKCGCAGRALPFMLLSRTNANNHLGRVFQCRTHPSFSGVILSIQEIKKTLLVVCRVHSDCLHCNHFKIKCVYSTGFFPLSLFFFHFSYAKRTRTTKKRHLFSSPPLLHPTHPPSHFTSITPSSSCSSSFFHFIRIHKRRKGQQHDDSTVCASGR